MAQWVELGPHSKKVQFFTFLILIKIAPQNHLQGANVEKILLVHTKNDFFQGKPKVKFSSIMKVKKNGIDYFLIELHCS